MIVFSAVREATPSNKYKKYEIGGVTFRVTCILLISMETTKDKRALFDGKKSQLQNTIFQLSHHQLCIFASVEPVCCAGNKKPAPVELTCCQHC